MNIFLYTINSKETNSSDTSNESSSSSVSNKSNSSTTNNKTYTKEEISNNGVVTGTSGVTYGWADNLSSSHKTINNESCLFLTNDDCNYRYAGLQTLNIYDENGTIVDKVKLE